MRNTKQGGVPASWGGWGGQVWNGHLARVHFSQAGHTGVLWPEGGTSPCMMLRRRMRMIRSQTYIFTCARISFAAAT